MNSRDHAVEAVASKVFSSQHHNGRIIAHEQPHDWRGRELTEDPAYGTKTHAEQDGDLQRLPAPFVQSRSRVLCGDSRYGREHRGRHKEQEADDLLHDADRGSDINAAAVRDSCDDKERDLNETVLTGNRKADAHNMVQCIAIRPEIFPCNLNADATAAERKECDSNTHSLARHSGSGRTGSSHRHRADEKIVPYDVDHTGNRNEDHRTLRITHAAENARDHIVGRDERHADETDRKIPPRFIDCLRGHIQNVDDASCRRDKKKRCDNCIAQE